MTPKGDNSWSLVNSSGLFLAKRVCCLGQCLKKSYQTQISQIEQNCISEADSQLGLPRYFIKWSYCLRISGPRSPK